MAAVKIHSFGIHWDAHGLVTHVAASKEEIEAKVTNYLRGEKDFTQFLKALKNNDLEEDDKAFVTSLLSPENSGVITKEMIDRLDEIDIDNLKYSAGRISGWGYSEEDIDLVASLGITTKDSLSAEFNESQKVMVAAYGGGDYKGFSPDNVHEVADGLFKFLVAELSTSEDCEDMTEALKRVDRATKELQNIADELAYAIITTSKKAEAQKPKTKKPSGPGM